MSIVQRKDVSDKDGKRVEATLLRVNFDEKTKEITDQIAPYNPPPEVVDVYSMILRDFVLGTTNSYTPRVEFNDLSLVARDQYDQMAFNTYQTNNGEAWQGAPQLAWRSRAVRPVVRNKAISIAAHATARLIFPKVFAFNKDSEEQKNAAQVMEDLIEWSGDISDYSYTALNRVITALYSPASIGYTEYGEVMRMVKTEKNPDGTWKEELRRDESYPCFMDSVVPVDQFYIQNFFEPDIQKQGWVIWRKVYSFSEAQNKYGLVYDNFKYVKPGVQTIYDDANRVFYYVYDPNMRQYDVEEIIYWNKNLDLKIIMVNGIMLTEHNNPNPRQDKLYPFDKFFYEPINNRFFYGKSLAFKLQQDAGIVSTLYQMIVDKTYLSIFPPMINLGGEIIASDVIVPGAVTTFQDKDADLKTITSGTDFRDAFQTLATVEKSINESSQEPLQQGVDNSPGGTTAYEISRLENNANTVLGLFLQMIAKHVKDFGRLRLGDIIQYLTVPDVVAIEGKEDADLVYKTFFLKGNGKDGTKNKRISFDNELPDEMEDEEYLGMSYDLLQEEEDKDMTIAKVNPGLFRELKYMITVSPDVMNPRSTDLERAYDLETYDRMIGNPAFDPQETGKFLLGTNPTTRRSPDKYLVKQPAPGQIPPEMGGLPQAGNSPLNAVGKKSPLSTNSSSSQLPSLAIK